MSTRNRIDKLLETGDFTPDVVALLQNVKKSQTDTTPKWYNVPRNWSDVVRCVLGYHRPVTTGYVNLMYVERCSCGAFGPRPWVYLSASEQRARWSRRK